MLVLFAITSTQMEHKQRCSMDSLILARLLVLCFFFLIVSIHSSSCYDSIPFSIFSIFHHLHLSFSFFLCLYLVRALSFFLYSFHVCPILVFFPFFSLHFIILSSPLVLHLTRFLTFCLLFAVCLSFSMSSLLFPFLPPLFIYLIIVSLHFSSLFSFTFLSYPSHYFCSNLFSLGFYSPFFLFILFLSYSCLFFFLHFFFPDLLLIDLNLPCFLSSFFLSPSSFFSISFSSLMQFPFFHIFSSFHISSHSFLPSLTFNLLFSPVLFLLLFIFPPFILSCLLLL